jgi:beta-lactamase regulating signal transducer with metallopeptidase domain
MSAQSLADAALRMEPAALLTKVTLILVVACMIALVTRRASAAVRHLVWLLALAACAAIMVLSPLAPAISLAVQREEPSVVTNDMSERSSAVSRSLVRSREVAESRLSPTIVASAGQPSSARQTRTGLASWLASNAAMLVVGVWILGGVVVLMRCVVGHRVVYRLVRRARDADPELWNAALASLARDQGIGRRVRLSLDDTLAAPITVGWLRPLILLPSDANEWTEERRRVVLVHELAHIARGDYVAQLVATVALAFLWFHPLVWLAVARLRAEAEQAADDCVIASGVAGVTYAAHLLEIARAMSRLQLSPAIAVGMARPSHMERRFRAMLDSRRSRGGIRARTCALATLASMGLMTPVAGLRTVARAMPQSQSLPPEPPSRNAGVSTISAPPAPAPPRASVRRSNETDSIVEKTVDAVSGGHLRITLPTGGGVIVHGWESPSVRVHAQLGGSDWRLVRIALDRSGRDVRLSSTFTDAGTHGTELWFEIWTPGRSDIDLSSAGGSIEISNVDGDLVGETGGGNLTIRNANGFASLSTGGGDIDIADSDLGGRVTTGWGRVSLHNVKGGLRGLTMSGPVVAPVTSTVNGRTVTTTNSSGCVALSIGSSPVVTTVDAEKERTPIRASGLLSLVKPGGSIDVASAPDGATLSTGGGHIFVDESNKVVVASTGGGDVELRRSAGDATASTGAGNVTISVVNTDGAEHNINVCDGHGRVILELPVQLDATFELETAYTDGFGRRTNIESDFPLEQSETAEWDDRHGTPRKFVRAVGKSGNGAGLIRVNTVNGDIVVRRR